MNNESWRSKGLELLARFADLRQQRTLLREECGRFSPGTIERRIVKQKLRANKTELERLYADVNKFFQERP